MATLPARRNSAVVPSIIRTRRASPCRHGADIGAVSGRANLAPTRCLTRTLSIGWSMRNLLRNRRGSVAFATVVALVPLIGVVALGAEAGSWYVTKQHAQNAADAAAYSGALDAGVLDFSGSIQLRYIHKTMFIAASNLPRRMRSATRANRTTVLASPFGRHHPEASRSISPTSDRSCHRQPETAGIPRRAAWLVHRHHRRDSRCRSHSNRSHVRLALNDRSRTHDRRQQYHNRKWLRDDVDGTVKYNSTREFHGSGWSVNAQVAVTASAGHCAMHDGRTTINMPACDRIR